VIRVLLIGCGDVALRTYVCGDDACESGFRASPEQLAQMAALVEQALAAGALGYSISRSLTHRVPDGRWVPGTWSDPAEFAAIAEPLARLGRGILECAPRFNEEDGHTSRVEAEMAWIGELSRRTGRPFTFNLTQMRALGDHYLEVLRLAEAANSAGARLRPQTTPRSIGVLFSLAANTLLDALPSFQALRVHDLDGRLAGLRDPAVRAALAADAAGQPVEPFRRMYVMRPETGARYEYTDGDSLAALAAARDVHPLDAYIDVLLETDGRAVVNWPVLNEDFSAIATLLASPLTIMGLADAGAHATQIMDASQPTFFLAHWVRDREALTLEEGVRRLTSDTADFAGFTDRGVIREGAYADLNVLDLEALRLPLPEIVHDFPGRAPRFVQRAEGVDHTIVNGQLFMEQGEHTGARPGRLLRAGSKRPR